MTLIQQAFKSDTLAVDLDAAAVTGTLTTGNFGTPAGEQMLVVDYDNSSREIIKCAIAGTGLTSIDRAQDGTSDVDHVAGAKVIMTAVPSHYGDLGKIPGSDAWSTWVPVITGFSGTPTATRANYFKIGRIVFIDLLITGTSNATTFTFTLPYASEGAGLNLPCRVTDSGTVQAGAGLILLTASSTTADVYKTLVPGAFTNSGTKAAYACFMYMASS